LLLSGFSVAENISDIESLNRMEPGEAKLLNVHGKRLYIYKVANQDLQNLKVLDNHVFDLERVPFIEEMRIFAVWAVSTKSSCLLKYIPPKTTPSGNTWLGGYYDPCGDVNYDIAGRAIKTRKFTMNNYNIEYPNLNYPKIKHLGGTEIGIYNSGI
jgi:hypothetical protein